MVDGRVLAGSCFCHRGHNSASGAASAELPTRQHASATANASITNYAWSVPSGGIGPHPAWIPAFAGMTVWGFAAHSPPTRYRNFRAIFMVMAERGVVPISCS